MQVWQLQETFCNNPFIQKICSAGRNQNQNRNQKSDFYELWQQQKQLKTMKMSESWSDIYDEGYIPQFQHEPTHKIICQHQKYHV